MRDPIIAGVLSLILPGLGQIYNGRVLAGILWLIFASGLWFGTGFLFGWILHLVAAYCAYSYAKEHPVRI
jgi:TM2 domain-containing membrane protein YozV